MDRRRFLSTAVTVLLMIVLISFVWVLFSGVNTDDLNEYYESDEPQHTLFKDLNQGQVVLRRYQGQAVWVLSLTEIQKAQAQELNAYVLSETTMACNIDNAFCVLDAVTQRFGINTHYTKTSPAKLAVGIPWYGGFVDPTNGSLYDFLGRAYTGQQNQKSMNSIEVH